MALVIHPFLTHYPVALLSLGSLVYFYGTIKNNDKFLDRSTFMILLGFLIGIITALAGTFDASRAGFFPTIHASFAITTLVIYFVGYYLHLREKRNYAMFLFFIGLLTVLTTGYLGGQLVFEYGVNVG